MAKKDTSQFPYYPDIWLFLILIPFINGINYFLTYANIKFNLFFIVTYINDTFLGYIVWLFSRKLILYFDRRIPYQNGILRRMSIQLVTTTFVGLTFISLMTEISSYIANGEPASSNFYTVDLIIIGTWFFFLNAIYLGLYYYNRLKLVEHKMEQEQVRRRDGFIVKIGKKDLRLDFEELIGFYVDTDYTIAQDTTGKKYYIDESLEKIENRLHADTFFRLNRKCIVHRNIISGFKRIENGKLLVLLHRKEFFDSEISVSRSKAPAFKTWFRPNR